MIYVFEESKFLFVFSTCFKSNLQEISSILSSSVQRNEKDVLTFSNIHQLLNPT